MNFFFVIFFLSLLFFLIFLSAMIPFLRRSPAHFEWTIIKIWNVVICQKMRIQRSSKWILSDEFQVEHLIINVMVFIIQLTESQIRSQHTWPLSSTKVNRFILVFLEYVAIAQSTHLVKRLSHYRFVMPVSIIHPFNHQYHLLPREILPSGYFILL